MIIADFECANKRCKKLEEDVLIESHVWYKTCRHCGHDAKRIITIGRVNMANEDAQHIREAAKTLLDPETARHSDKPHVRDLAESPTRSNLQRYLKAEGLRYAENEKGAPPLYRKPEPINREKLRREVLDGYRKERSISIETSRH